jgi:NADH-quinone oxidoreductase subunit C
MPFTPPSVDDILAALAARFGDLATSVFRGQTRVVVPAERSFAALELLKSRGFDLLVDVSCVDYLEYRDAPMQMAACAGHRYGLVYLLASTATNQRLTLRVFVDDPAPAVASAVPLWEAANWLEREVWDLFGIRFEGHPDLRRLVMPEEFTAHPLRKDYPLQGRGERHNFPVITREHS